MTVIGIQSSIWSNRFKTLILLISFPILVFGIVFGAIYGLGLYALNTPNPQTSLGKEYTEYVDYKNLLKQKQILENAISSGNENYNYQLNSLNEILQHYTQKKYSQKVINLYDYAQNENSFQKSIDYAILVFSFLGPIILIWALISFTFYRQIIFAFTNAKAITRVENPTIYNIVENLCISRGLPTPNIGILEDNSYNAFAVGWNPKSAWIVFSRGILNTMSKEEIEAVAAHELTHIMNKDGLLLITVIVFIGAVAGIGEMMFRSARYMGSSRDSDSKGNQLQIIFFVVGLALLILGYIILPVMQLAVSRKREYLADAGSVELTHNNLSLISALQKISQDSTIESIKKDTVSALCIDSPFPKSSGFMNSFHEFFSTHPSIEHRIEMLEKY